MFYDLIHFKDFFVVFFKIPVWRRLFCFLHRIQFLSWGHLILTALYCVQIFLFYLLMLGGDDRQRLPSSGRGPRGNHRPLRVRVADIRRCQRHKGKEITQ